MIDGLGDDTLYEAWLNRNAIREEFSDETFAFKQMDLNSGDAIALRIHKEIIEWLKRPILDDYQQATIIFTLEKNGLASDDAFRLVSNQSSMVISAQSQSGLLYGFYALIRERMLGKKNIRMVSAPDQTLRMIDHWDQIDGSIERGYAGASIFFGTPDHLDNPDKGDFSVLTVQGDPFRHDRVRMLQYARMLASIGINAISLNNVNVRSQGTDLITAPYLDGVKEIADIFRGFGIKIYLAINWESPIHIGHLKNSDPLDPRVETFWKTVCDGIYHSIPDFGGFVVKADSEGEPGPYQYGRTHAEGANMLARAIAPHDGLIIWRAFVYNSHQDWRDRSTDRAKAAYENFEELDGKFDDNVILQIKFGPIDFQTVEPLQPLFGKLTHTNQMMEFELTAEYLGHQIDINYAVPQWSKMINFDTKHSNFADSKAGEVIKEGSVKSQNSGFAAVGNVGMTPFWTGNPLALANLYGYGRLCWGNQLDSSEILSEWIEQTFTETKVKTRQTIFEIMVESNKTYRNYTAPLGVGFMVIPYYHYGVSVNGYEYDKWGTYHFADRNGVGVDRTQKSGTGFTAMYSPAVARMFEGLESTPLELTLFFHHVRYSQMLSNHKTLIQTIYDQHFAGFDTVSKYVADWSMLEADLPVDLFSEVQNRLKQQLENALEWRDQINTYFYRLSGIPDELGREIYQ